jgi:uncharacterized RDD family membrane protein YckC
MAGYLGLAGTGNEGFRWGARKQRPGEGHHVDGSPTGRRVAAGFADLLVLVAAFWLMAAVFGDLSRNSLTLDAGMPLPTIAAYAILVLVYYTGSEWKWRATPGKLLLDVRIASADERPLTFGRVFVRQVLRVIDMLPVLYLLGFVLVEVTKRHQRIGDMAARTIVVRRAAVEPHSNHERHAAPVAGTTGR